MRVVEIRAVRSIATGLIEDMTDWFDRNGYEPLPLDRSQRHRRYN